MNDLANGAEAGCAATVPMTWAMEVMHRLLPPEERHPLPPREITERVANAAGVNDQLGESAGEGEPGGRPAIDGGWSDGRRRAS